jgi:hypothetical protein
MTMTQKNIFLIAIIALVAASRLLNITNFTPVIALAFFGGAIFKNRFIGFIAPVLAIFITDLALTFQNSDPSFIEYFTKGQFIGIYLLYILSTFFGTLISKNITITKGIFGTLISVAFFFIGSNFLVWMDGVLYPKTSSGLLACYEAAIPFIRTQLLSNAAVALVLFGVYEMYFSKTSEKIKA